jgi:hypothetical protein
VDKSSSITRVIETSVLKINKIDFTAIKLTYLSNNGKKIKQVKIILKKTISAIIYSMCSIIPTKSSIETVVIKIEITQPKLLLFKKGSIGCKQGAGS